MQLRLDPKDHPYKWENLLKMNGTLCSALENMGLHFHECEIGWFIFHNDAHIPVSYTHILSDIFGKKKKAK